MRLSLYLVDRGRVDMGRVCMVLDLVAEFVMGRVCQGPSLLAEAIRTTVVPISCVIRTTVVPISGVIGPTVVRIANATGIGYRHDGSIRFSNKLTYALNY